MIPKAILDTYAHLQKKYAKDQHVFVEKSMPIAYYQVITGEIKVYNLTQDAKEFVQGYFQEDQSFGEPPLLGNFPYPANAIATKSSVVCAISKTVFLQILEQHPDIHLKLTTHLCKRIQYKAIIMKEVSIHPPEHRILTLLQYLKQQAKSKETLFYIDLTRQKIAELTGLRVETVIRAIKKLEKQKQLTLIDKKIHV